MVYIAVTSWVKASIGLAVFGFINLVLFVVLSQPTTMIFNTVENQSSNFGVSAQVNPILNMIRTVFGVTFVLSMVGLVVWFFLGSHVEEGEEY